MLDNLRFAWATYPGVVIVLGLVLAVLVWLGGLVALFDGHYYRARCRRWCERTWAFLVSVFEPDPQQQEQPDEAKAFRRAQLELATRMPADGRVDDAAIFRTMKGRS